MGRRTGLPGSLDGAEIRNEVPNECVHLCVDGLTFDFIKDALTTTGSRSPSLGVTPSGGLLLRLIPAGQRDGTGTSRWR